MNERFETVGSLRLAGTERSFRLEIDGKIYYVGVKGSLDVLQKRRRSTTIYVLKNLHFSPQQNI